MKDNRNLRGKPLATRRVRFTIGASGRKISRVGRSGAICAKAGLRDLDPSAEDAAGRCPVVRK